MPARSDRPHAPNRRPQGIAVARQTRWSPESRASSAVRALFDPAISAAAVEYVKDWPPLTAAQCAAVRAVGLAIVRKTDADGRADG